MRGLLFDKDGTLLDFEASWAGVYRDLCLDLSDGDAAAAEVMLRTGGLDPATGRFRAGCVLAAGHTRDIVAAWYPALAGAAHDAMVARIDRVFYENGITHSVPVPRLAETLATLAGRGYAMGVATNDGTAATQAALSALGVTDHLTHIFGYDSVPHPKPAPDIVLAFAAAIGCAPAEVLVIGDNPHDIEMARRAGAGAALGVLTGNSDRAILEPLADAVLDSIADLPAWLDARAADAS